MMFLGLDFGDRTIGVAVSLNGRVATGVSTIFRDSPDALRPSLKELKRIINEYKITHIVLGYPMHLDGRESPRCVKTLAFKEKLTRYFRSITVELWDERLSTAAVTRVFQGRREDYKKRVDEMAAVYILQGFLDNYCANRRTLFRRRLMMSNEKDPIAWDNIDNEEDHGVVIYTDDGDELPLQILASREGENCMYVLAVEEDDTDVAHFKCVPGGEDEVIFELIDEDHEDFERVFEMFKDDYESLGIEFEEVK